MATKKRKTNAEKKSLILKKYRFLSIISFGIGLLSFFLSIIKGENLWLFFRNIYFGIFGITAYIIPVMCIGLAFFIAKEKHIDIVKKVFFQIISMFLIVSTILQILFNNIVLYNNFFDKIANGYTNGAKLKSTGVLGVILSTPFEELFGKLGSLIILIILLLVLLMIFTNKSVLDIFKINKKPKDKPKHKEEHKEEHKEKENNHKNFNDTYEFESHKNVINSDVINDGFKRKDIDISLDEVKKTKKIKKSKIDIPLEDDVIENTDTLNDNTENEILKTDKTLYGELIEQTCNEDNLNISLHHENEEDKLHHENEEDVLNNEGEILESIPIWSEENKKESTDIESFNNIDEPENFEKTTDNIITEKVKTDLFHDGILKYSYPPNNLLDDVSVKMSNTDTEELRKNADKLLDTLKSFGVKAKLLEICKGPAVTRYELQPDVGVKISKITGLADDIALSLAASGIRIEAPIPNKAAIGIEVPNKSIDIVKVKDIISSKEFENAESKLSVALGKDITGNVTLADLSKMPHLLVAGSTGSGKSVCINTIISSILFKASPDEVKLLMIDPKVVELGIYNGIPHLLVPVVTDPKKASGALGWAVSEMLKRYNLFAESNVRDLKGYNKMAKNKDGVSELPQIVIIIDELSDLMMASPREVEDYICRLAQMARAAGMHLIIATQRPSVDVITGTIKANIPSRIAFAVSSQIDSRTILDASGAEKLLGRGDMLFSPVGSSKPLRVQGCFITDEEVERIVGFIKESGQASYDNNVLDEIEKQSSANAQNSKSNVKNDIDDCDSMMDNAIEIALDLGQVSTSLLQRKLRLGYARAARIVDEMEDMGIVGPMEGSKPRQILITRQQWIEMNLNKSE
ncbi:MAG: DNA translocase FtsK 4TM domain-containing protein [Oscillospiraceae bacterium]